jgi:hypothetical protein
MKRWSLQSRGMPLIKKFEYKQDKAITLTAHEYQRQRILCRSVLSHDLNAAGRTECPTVPALQELYLELLEKPVLFH